MLTEASFYLKKSLLSEFCKFSTRLVRHTRVRRHELQLPTVFGVKEKHRFLAGEKMSEFAKIQCENAGKILHFFAFIGNTECKHNLFNTYDKVTW